MSILNWTDNAPAVQLTASVGLNDTTFRVSTSGGFPVTPFEFAIDLGSAPELVLCEEILSNTSWQVIRGWDHSTPQAHSPKAGQIELITSEQFWVEANDHLMGTGLPFKVQTFAFTETAQTTFGEAVTSTPTRPGSTLLIFVGLRIPGGGTPTVTSITDSSGVNVWQPIPGSVWSTTTRYMAWYICTDAAPVSEVTLNVSEACTMDFQVGEWIGLGTAPVADLATSANGTSTTPSITTAGQTSQAPELVLVGASIGQGTTSMSGQTAGFTLGESYISLVTSAGLQNQVAYEILQSKGAVSYGLTLGTSATWGLSVISFPFPGDQSHAQYMRTDGTGHDDPTKHTVGTGNYVAVNTENDWQTFGSAEAHEASFFLKNRFSQLYLTESFDPTQPPPSHWGDTSFDGLSQNPANGLHVHPRESEDELAHLFPPGILALWGGRNIPPGWLPADGRDVRTDLAPLCFEQWGYTAGTAIAWYPSPPILPTYIAYQDISYTDPNNEAQLQIAVPYSYMQDPRTIAMQLPYGEPTYFKLPNIPAPYPGLSWIVKMDYGYTWEPRPAPPPPLPIYCSPFAVDQVLPSLTYTDSWNLQPGWNQTTAGSKIQQDTLVSEAPHPPGLHRTNLTWGFDAVSGLPVIGGSDYIAPGQEVRGSIAVPVYPFGESVPEGFTLLHPPQPAYQVGPPIIVSEELVQLYALRVNVKNGFGWALTDIPWPKLASGPWVNASYPPVDGNYLNGIAQVQQRNNLIAVTVSQMKISNPGQPDTLISGSIAVNFFVYS